MDYFDNSLGFGDEDHYGQAIGWSWDPPKTEYVPLDIMNNVYYAEHLKRYTPQKTHLKEIKDFIEGTGQRSRWNLTLINELKEISQAYDLRVKKMGLQCLTKHGFHYEDMHEIIKTY